MGTRSLKGITVEIDGNTSKLTTALKGVNGEIKTTQERLKDVNTLLKIDPSNVELLAKKQNLLGDAIDSTSDKLKVLKTAQDQATEALEKGTMTQDQYNALTAEIVRTESSLKNLTAQQENAQSPIQQLNTKIENQTTDLKLLKDKYADVVIKEGENSASAKDLAGKISDLSSELKDNKEKLQDAKSKADELDQSFDNVGDAAEDSAKKSENAANGGYTTLKNVMANLASEGIQKVVDGLKEIATEAWNSAIEYQSAFTGVTKTVEGTDEQLAEIDKGLRDFATKSASEYKTLAGVAENAGQLGIARDNIVDFTKIMTMLGDTTNLSADEASSALAKLANITGLDPKEYSNLGSAIVDLGNNFATTESDIVAMTTRLASSANIAGFKTSDMLALATALNSVGIEAEAGGSAVSKTIKKMQLAVETGWWKKPTNKTPGVSLKEIAKIAGMTEKEFKKLFKSNPAKALASFVDGLSNTERNGKSAIAVLDDLSISDVRQSNALLALTKSNGLLTKAVDKSSNAWEDNTALTKEAEKRYSTMESKMIQTKNAFSNVTSEMGKEFFPVVEKVTDKLTDFLNQHGDDLVDFAGDLADGFGWVIDHGDSIIDILKDVGIVVGTAFATQKISDFIGVIKTLSIDTIGKTAGAGLLGGALGVAGIALNEIFSPAEYDFSEYDKLLEKANEVKEKFDDWKASKDKATEKVDNDFTYYQGLWDQLQGLIDQNGRIKKGYENQAKYITDKLNPILGDQALIIDNKIVKNWDKVNDKIQEQIEKQRILSTIEGYADEYQNSIIGQPDAIEAISSASKALEKFKSEHENDKDSSGHYFGDLENEYWNLSKAYSDALDEYDTYQNFIRNYNNLINSSTTGTVEDQTLAMLKLRENYGDTTKMTWEQLTVQQKQIRDHWKVINDIHENGTGDVDETLMEAWNRLLQEADEGFDKASQKSYEKSKEVASSGVKGTESQKGNMAKSGENNAKAYNKSIDSQKGNSKASGYNLGVNTFNGLNSFFSKYKLSDIAREAIAGYLDVMKNSNSINDVTRAAANLGVATLKGMTESLDINSPSRETEKIADYTTSGYVNELLNKRSEVAEAARTVANTVLDEFDNDLNIKANIGFDLVSLDNIKRSIQNNPMQVSYGQQFNTQPKGDTINNFTQNNYSPKELSRHEIYRQTKNLIKTIKTTKG